MGCDCLLPMGLPNQTGSHLEKMGLKASGSGSLPLAPVADCDELAVLCLNSSTTVMSWGPYSAVMRRISLPLACLHETQGIASVRCCCFCL